MARLCPRPQSICREKKDPYESEWREFVNTNRELLEELRPLLQGEGSYNHSIVRITAELYRKKAHKLAEQFFAIGQLSVYSRYYIAKRETICLELSEAMRKAGIDPEPFYK